MKMYNVVEAFGIQDEVMGSFIMKETAEEYIGRRIREYRKNNPDIAIAPDYYIDYVGHMYEETLIGDVILREGYRRKLREVFGPRRTCSEQCEIRTGVRAFIEGEEIVYSSTLYGGYTVRVVCCSVGCYEFWAVFDLEQEEMKPEIEVINDAYICKVSYK